MSPGQLRSDHTNPISNDLTIVSSSSKPLTYGHSTQHEFVSCSARSQWTLDWSCNLFVIFDKEKKYCVNNNQLYINQLSSYHSSYINKIKVTSPNQLKISLLVVFTLLLSISLLNSAVPVLTFYFLLIFLYIIFTYSHPSFFSLIALGFQLSQCFFHSPHLSFLLVLCFVARR